jgi:pyrroloquinoline-quinone synthase
MQTSLDFVLRHADTAGASGRRSTLVFKCDILWAMLDALQHAYGEEATYRPALSAA